MKQDKKKKKVGIYTKMRFKLSVRERNGEREHSAQEIYRGRGKKSLLVVRERERVCVKKG